MQTDLPRVLVSFPNIQTELLRRPSSASFGVLLYTDGSTLPLIIGEAESFPYKVNLHILKSWLIFGRSV